MSIQHAFDFTEELPIVEYGRTFCGFFHEQDMDALDRIIPCPRVMTEDYIAAALAAKRLSCGAYHLDELDDQSLEWFNWYQDGKKVSLVARMQTKVKEHFAWLVQRINENGLTARRGGVQSAFWLDHGAWRVRVFYTPDSTYDHFDFLCQSFPWDSGYVSQFTGGCVSQDADPRDVAEALLTSYLAERKQPRRAG